MTEIRTVIDDAPTAAAIDLGNEAGFYEARRAELLALGYVDIEHPDLRPGQRVRHRGERYPEAYDNGTGVIAAVMEHVDSPWSRSWGERDIELLVLKDKPLFEHMSRISGLASYHVAAVTP